MKEWKLGTSSRRAGMKARRHKHLVRDFSRQLRLEKKRKSGKHDFYWRLGNGLVADERKRTVIKLQLSSMYGKLASYPIGSP